MFSFENLELQKQLPSLSKRKLFRLIYFIHATCLGQGIDIVLQELFEKLFHSFLLYHAKKIAQYWSHISIYLSF